jgi:nicotinate phosphoribosyltransferase
MLVRSLLDTDLYKFTMMQVVLHHFPGAHVEYRFKCRTEGVDLVSCIPEIERGIADLCALRFTGDELAYLRRLRFMKSDYVDLLGLFQLDGRFVEVRPLAGAPGEIDIAIKGPWLHTILFEVPLLAIVSETWNRRTYPNADRAEGRRRLAAKIARINEVSDPDFRIADYGTRRRHDREWQEEVIETLQSGIGPKFVGTSNVDLARRHELTPLGTMAHEYLQACQAVGPRLRDSQRFAFDTWAKEYRGDLGIALSDVCGMDAFLRDFDLFFCKLFDGVRHDSGDPFEWGEKLIAHYRAMRIDPKSKVMVFSDQLTVPLAIRLFEHFRGRSQIAFGIGTNLTNDLGHPALSIVIKMTRCNGQPVAKISDEPSKSMDYDPSYVAYLREVFQVPVPPPAAEQHPAERAATAKA